MDNQSLNANSKNTSEKDTLDMLDEPNYSRGIWTDYPCRICDEAADRRIEGSSTSNMLIYFADDDLYHCGYCGYIFEKDTKDD